MATAEKEKAAKLAAASLLRTIASTDFGPDSRHAPPRRISLVTPISDFASPRNITHLHIIGQKMEVSKVGREPITLEGPLISKFRDNTNPSMGYFEFEPVLIALANSIEASPENYAIATDTAPLHYGIAINPAPLQKQNQAPIGTVPPIIRKDTGPNQIKPREEIKQAPNRIMTNIGIIAGVILANSAGIVITNEPTASIEDITKDTLGVAVGLSFLVGGAYVLGKVVMAIWEGPVSDGSWGQGSTYRANLADEQRERDRRAYNYRQEAKNSPFNDPRFR